MVGGKSYIESGGFPEVDSLKSLAVEILVEGI